MVAAGQAHGAIVQGIGQALMERASFDTSTGQPVTGTWMDYTMPRADDLVSIDLGFSGTPCTTNPLGVKGVGEAGIVGAFPAVTNAVLDRLRKGKHLLKDEKLARLSPQEERILSLVADGRTNREIGDDLHLAEKTVKNYVSSILSKLEVARRAEAAAYLARHTATPGA
jgi:DNA-binding CsgD family transcriptional regulator